MKKYAILMILASSVFRSLFAYGQEDRTPRLGNFNSVSIQIPSQTVIVRGKERALDIDMSDSTARKVDIFNDRGTLVIKSRSGSWIRRSDSIKIRITMPSWESLNVSASGTLRSDDQWSLDMVKIKSTGSCDIFLNALTALSTEINVSGSGNFNMNLLDTSKSFSLDSTGSGNVSIQDLRSSEADIKLTGSGNMTADVDASLLSARLTGSGDIRVSGHVSRAELQTTGSGSIDGDNLTADEANIKITGSGDISLSENSRIKEIRMTGSGVFRSR